MTTKRKTEITIEVDRVWVIRRRGEAVPAWCDGCGGPVQMATLEEAVALARVSSRTIYRWVEEGRLHFAETPAGLLLLCLNSLTQGC